ncbi:BTAD domain-containing putative transcriptional regulator [Microbacterium sp. BK668]|uniref:AfsR/SARP family transcriptional regulator n=1 Tax=Microbacterium sp. BK668 TaxID=2512118 RepID=UPI0014152447|nr:BTAD domain-containing putative transcriptional regulator [Microbacterium sp. BK668]
MTATLQLLGCWRLAVSGRAVAVPRRDQRVIAAIALLDPRPRRQLAEILWPDGSRDHAQANLRVNLSDIRRHYPGILADSDPLSLAPGVGVDVASLRLLPSIIDGETECSRLREWLEFARRAELLPGWYETWLDLEQERVRQLRLSALEILGRTLLKYGDADGALSAATIALDAEPWRESSYELQMRAHILAGNRALALRVYESARSMLLRELDVEPAPILSGLAQELRYHGSV